jgi:hypothetical protein
MATMVFNYPEEKIKKLDELELEPSWFDHSGKSLVIYRRRNIPIYSSFS